ncbi:MAG: hypothetical protein CMQ60_00125 [Gammaproteobacteria bacterium]|nr:hypothetical protein [Gammaproteobacteria bacterium]|tara:strand:+ start:758 stop:1477 length:720 start_codon:yes stop_codon:yes gene_type:complete
MNKIKSFWHEDIEPGYYDKIINEGLEKNKGLQSNWHNCTYKKVLHTISNSSNNLDYACGSGTFIGRYLQIKATGVDIALEQINYAKSKFKDKKFFSVDEFNNLNTEEKFQTITVLGLIEFLTVDEFLDILKELGKLLDKNGKIVLTTPNYSIVFKVMQKLSTLAGINNYSEVTLTKFRKKEIIKILKGTEFKNIDVKKIVNFGIFFSIFSHNLGLKIENFIEKYFLNYFGFVLIIEIKN